REDRLLGENAARRSCLATAAPLPRIEARHIDAIWPGGPSRARIFQNEDATAIRPSVKSWRRDWREREGQDKIVRQAAVKHLPAGSGIQTTIHAAARSVVDSGVDGC